MTYKRTNGGTPKHYHTFTIWGKTFSFTTGQLVKTVIYAGLIIKSFYGYVEPVYDNVMQIPGLIQTVDSTQREFREFRFAVEDKWKWQDSVYMRSNQ